MLQCGGDVPNTLCACDESSDCVSVATLPDNTVTATLIKPNWVREVAPYKLGESGNTILVMYGLELVVYENSVSSSGTMIAWPAGLRWFSGMSSNGVSRFLVCDTDSKAVFVRNVSGVLSDKINIDIDSNVEDFTVGDGKLWMGCWNGDIVVMSPR